MLGEGVLVQVVVLCVRPDGISELVAKQWIVRGGEEGDVTVTDEVGR
jgi:hypothetical protein